MNLPLRPSLPLHSDHFGRIALQKLIFFGKIALSPKLVKSSTIVYLTKEKLEKNVKKGKKIQCNWRESNPQPLNYKPTALPIELPRLTIKIVKI